ncbi:nucleotidyl transferase AbiEii/AbiGii toxin family protein, partial [candidate division KSB1 bacterium]|nr:nucleotidyl transferase AbiEii/AbiGii toxin family protein [candidate division KSB1 bacterium]
SMGRDFLDTIFLLGKTKPDLNYLKSKAAINNFNTLKSSLLTRCKELDLKSLVKDVEPFLVQPSGSKNILYFCDYIKQIDL